MNRQAQATLREIARILRTDRTAQDVLRALRCCPLTAGELVRVLRERHKRRTIYGALQRLRLVGIVEGGRKVRRLGGRATEWRVN